MAEFTAAVVQQLPSILPELVLAVGAIVLLALDLWTKPESKGFLSDAASVIVLAALAALLWTTDFGRTPVLGGMFFADRFSIYLRAVLYSGLFLVYLMGKGYLRRNNVPPGEYVVLLMFATVGTAFVVGAADLIAFYLGLEVLSIASYVLAGLRLGNHKSQEAALKYFLNGGLSSAIILFGLSLLFGLTGTTSLQEMSSALAAGGTQTAVLATALAFVIGGLGFKVAAVPFHLWVPDTYEGAPTPVTAFLSVISKGAAFGAALRIFYTGLEPVMGSWTMGFALLSAVTMLVGNVSALHQDNVKRLLGYSSIAQAGYILISLAAGSQEGIAAGLFYILAYVFTNLGAFAVIVAVSNDTGSDHLDAFRGLSRRNGFLAGAMAFFALSLVGVPFTAGFFGKLYLMRAGLDAGLNWLVIWTAINSVISVGYYFKLIQAMYIRDYEPAAAETTVLGAGGHPPAMAGGSGETGEGADAVPPLRPGMAIMVTVFIALAGTVLIGTLPMFIEWAGVASFLP